MEDFIEKVQVAKFTIGIVSAFTLVFAIPQMWLRNYVMLEMFGLKQISWGQMTCLSLLSGKLLNPSFSSK